MFMMSFRLRRSGLLAAALVLVFALVLGIRGIGSIWPASVAADSTGAPPAKAGKISGKTNEDRVSFITSFGWEVLEEPVEILEVIIPKVFDEIYREYNNIQRAQGYNLEDHAGKRVKRYSYEITNYPGTDQPVRINVLVRKNKIIGGDVSSLDENGFIHGFEMKTA
ncbi:MAG: DUF4830 domain-containing protein [Oscillospiraceae bacterium]|nr:DUF4830 domain-containing protein [Oscillospiraceae bacterium]